MKITFTTSDFKGFVSGVHTWMQKFAIELRELGHDCFFLILTMGEGEYPFINFLEKNQFVYQSIPMNKFRYTDDRTGWIINETKNYDTDIFLPGFSVAGLYAIRWLKEAGILTINIIHSDDLFWQAVSERFVLNKKTKWNAQITFTVSKFIYDKIGGNIVSGLYDLPLGVVVSSKKAHLTDSSLQIVYIGRLEEEQKRISDTVRGLIMVLKKIDYPIRFDIYGSGSAERDIVKIIENEGEGLTINFKGAYKAEEVYEILSQYQVLVLLSDYEGLPISLLEAMTCGLVPICTNIKSGISQVIIPNKTGFIVNNRENDILNVVQEIISSPQKWDYISRNAKELVDTNFNIKIQTKKFVLIAVENLDKCKKNNITNTKIKLPPAHHLLHYGMEDVRRSYFINRHITNFSKKLKRIFYVI